MRQSRLAALSIGAAALMPLTLGAIAFYGGTLSANASEVRPLTPLKGVKVGKIQYLNSETAPNPKIEQAILRSLPDYSKDVSDPEQYMRYYYNRVDLNGDGQPEVIAYLVGSYSCGSGGCSAMIFTPKGQDYRLVSKLTLVNDPIVVTPQKTSGWKDLVLLVSGGGAKPQYSRLRFKGSAYPSNPSVQPAVTPNSTLTGIAVVADASSSRGQVLRPR